MITIDYPRLLEDGLKLPPWYTRVPQHSWFPNPFTAAPKDALTKRYGTSMGLQSEPQASGMRRPLG